MEWASRRAEKCLEGSFQSPALSHPRTPCPSQEVQHSPGWSFGLGLLPCGRTKSISATCAGGEGYSTWLLCCVLLPGRAHRVQGRRGVTSSRLQVK